MRRLSPALALLIAIAPLACDSDSAEEAANSAADAMRQAADAMQRAADDMADNMASDAGNDAEDAEPMTAQAMQDRLPEELAGLERTSSERQSTGVAGLTIANAKATYEGDGKELEVSLMSGAGVVAGPAMAFTMVDFDRSDDNGYERTIEIDGMKGMQEYEEDGDTRHAVMMVLVNKNLMVRLEADGMTMDEVEAVFDDLDPKSMN